MGELPEEFTHRGEAVLPALIFPWREPDGVVFNQLRPREGSVIDAKGRLAKYLWPVGGVCLLGERRANPEAPRVLIVEGTKQSLAAAGYAPEGVAVYGIAGCRTWQREGVPTPHLSICDGREVFICLDDDQAANLDVYEAGLKLAEAVKMEGATGVRFVRLAGGKKAGLDDVLGRQPDDRRTAYLTRLLDHAAAKPADVKPKARKRITSPIIDGGEDSEPQAENPDSEGNPFFGDTGLQVDDLHQAVMRKAPAALTAEHKVALYHNGFYQLDGAAFTGVVADLLGNEYRTGHECNVEKYTVGLLHNAGLTLPVHIDVPMLNVANGMLDLESGTLKPHDPVYRSSMQIPIEWDEDATCPNYEAWLAEIVGDQSDDLEEVTSTMLDPSRTPSKAVFLFGPARSGKGTWLRLMQSMVGVRNISAITLHQLVSDRFAAANVFGKMLNVAADLSSAHIEDISIFKMMTGEDPIPANRKYGNQFVFTNRALFAFGANELPTVGESSRAYVERIKPFGFSNSFAGHEDPNIEAAMVAELQGILVRWVRAYRKLRTRGTYLQTDQGVRHEFEVRSDRVRQWVSEACTVVTKLPATTASGAVSPDVSAPGAVSPGADLPATHMTTRRDLARAFNRWAEDSGGAKMGERKIIDRLTSINGVCLVRRTGDRSRGLNIIIGQSGVEERAERAVSDLPYPDVERVVPLLGSEEVIYRKGGVETALSARPAPAPLEAGEYPRLDPGSFTAPGDLTLPPGVLALDLETGSSDELWTASPEWIRLTGSQTGGEIRVSTDPTAALELVEQASKIVGHNVMGYDLVALARHYGLDLHKLTAECRVVDTMLTEILNNPPEGGLKPEQVMRAHSLDRLGEAKFGVGKNGDLKKLAKEFGGYDKIPIDHAGYVGYLAQDVNLTARLAKTQNFNSYVKREHQVAAIAAQIRLNGFRVDVDLLTRRLEAGRDRRAELIADLIARYDLPTTNKAGKPAKSPHATAEGRDKLAAAFKSLGVDLPRTATDAAALGKDALDKVAKKYADRPDIIALVERVQALNGVRSVYETVERCRIGDRVHPEISMYQASGRWSITEPGLTVFGKRDGRYVEREIFLAEEGHVIIAVDLAQVDARAVAAWCQDEAYLNLFEPGRDSHTEIALKVWGDASRRQDAKVIGHGWNYGMGMVRLASQCGSEGAAREYDRAMREQFPDLVAWKRDVYEQAAGGELLDNGFGRKLRCIKGREWTQAPALMGQGTARDLMMEGLLNLPAYVLPMLRAVVHDEIVLSIPATDAEDIKREVVNALSFEWAPPGASRTVRIEAGCEGPGKNWGSVYEK